MSMAERTFRLFTVGPENEPLWLRLYVQQIEDRWAAMLVADGEPAPAPGTLKGIALFGATPEEAEREAKAYLRQGEAAN